MTDPTCTLRKVQAENADIKNGLHPQGLSCPNARKPYPNALAPCPDPVRYAMVSVPLPHSLRFAGVRRHPFGHADHVTVFRAAVGRVPSGAPDVPREIPGPRRAPGFPPAIAGTAHAIIALPEITFPGPPWRRWSRQSSRRPPGRPPDPVSVRPA